MNDAKKWEDIYCLTQQLYGKLDSFVSSRDPALRLEYFMTLIGNAEREAEDIHRTYQELLEYQRDHSEKETKNEVKHGK